MAEDDQSQTPPEGGEPTPSPSPEPGAAAAPVPDPLADLTAKFETFSGTLNQRLAALETRLTSPPPAATPATPPREITRDDVEAAFQAGKISDADRIEYLAEIRAKRLLDEDRLSRRQEQATLTASQELQEFIRFVPALGTIGSKEHTQVMAEINRMALRGTAQYTPDGKPTMGTQLDAVEKVLGSLDKVRSRESIRTATQAGLPVAGHVGGGGGEPTPGKPGDPWERLTQDTRDFYTKSGYSPDDVRRFLGKHTDEGWWAKAVRDGRAKR